MVPALQTQNLTRRFGRTDAVRELTFSIPAGSVCALIGPNGAGKTTTIRLLMNLLSPSAGRSEVLGVDSRRLTAATLARIGYVSESQVLPESMSLEQLAAFSAPLYPAWDTALAARLSQQLMVPSGVPVKAMSRGARMKTALVLALAPRPELLVMDEPFSGLDPLMREEVGDALRATAGGRTVLISSHEVEEVERLADWIAVLDKGRLVFAEPLADLQARFRDVEVACAQAPALSSLPPSWLAVETLPGAVRFVDSTFDAASLGAAVAHHLPAGRVTSVQPTSLRRAFLALARDFRRHQA
jgi:ABC-2 type transport system ATP-binding protein